MGGLLPGLRRFTLTTINSCVYMDSAHLSPPVSGGQEPCFIQFRVSRAWRNAKYTVAAQHVGKNMPCSFPASFISGAPLFLRASQADAGSCCPSLGCPGGQLLAAVYFQPHTCFFGFPAAWPEVLTPPPAAAVHSRPRHQTSIHLASLLVDRPAPATTIFSRISCF